MATGGAGRGAVLCLQCQVAGRPVPKCPFSLPAAALGCPHLVPAAVLGLAGRPGPARHLARAASG